jgi:hypothetical protein
MSSGAESRKPGVLPATSNARVLARELDWFERVLTARLQLHFGHQCDVAGIDALPPPCVSATDGDYAELVHELQLGTDERLLLALALVPHVRPQVLDELFVHNKNFDRPFTEFGGCKAKAHSGFLPSCETGAFLLAGDDLQRRLAVLPLFEPEHVLQRSGVLRITHDAAGEPALSAALGITREYLDRLTTGARHKPDYSVNFPAKLLTTSLHWDDLVLGGEVMHEVALLTTWIQHGHTVLHDWRLGRVLKPGYRSLFHGPPGTGKTLTASLIGKATGLDVYRIDLSMMVSKYIGETEKNLAQVFDQAERRRWILFFDEADALFGRRTATSSSNDRYANQEVSYLLQRVEDFPGTVLLATNLKGNIDEAFARRFQSLVYFPMPDAEQRLRLWHNMLQHTGRLEPGIDLAELAESYELAGGAIANVVRFAALSALQTGRQQIMRADLLDGITKELRKAGRTL